MRRPYSLLLIVGVPLAAVAALGGAYPSSVLPLLLGSAASFLLASPSVATRGWRMQDASLLVFLLGLGAQVVPLPGRVIDALSPHARGLANLLALVPSDHVTLSLRAVLTRDTFSSAATVILVYWTARSLLQGGGSRSTAKLLSGAGLAVALTGLAQRATAPRSLLWIWQPLDPGAKPMGPFVNRNHFAMWLVMASALAAGALATHLAHRHASESGTTRPALLRWLDDSTALWLGGTTALLWLTVIASASRGGMLAVAIFNGTWFALSVRRVGRRQTLLYAGALVAALGVVGIWANMSIIASRLTLGQGIARTTVWRDTLPLIHDFWQTGTGGGTFSSAMLLYQRDARFILFNEAQNEYLQLLAEGGLLLALPLAVWLISWLGTCVRRLAEDRSPIFWLRSAALAGLAGVATQCLWDSALRMPANAALAAILAAVAVHERPQPRGAAGLKERTHSVPHGLT